MTMVLLLVCCIVAKKVGRIPGIIMLVCYGGYFVYLLLSGGESAAPVEQLPSVSASVGSAMTLWL